MMKRKREREIEKDKQETESDLDKEREEEQRFSVGRRTGDHHQVKSSCNAPANNLKFKLRTGLQI